mgnify:CR=1 FL=1
MNIQLGCSIHMWDPTEGTHSVKDCVDVVNLDEVTAEYPIKFCIDHSDDCIHVNHGYKYGKYSFHSSHNKEQFDKLFKVVMENVDKDAIVTTESDGVSSQPCTIEDVANYF